MKFFDPKQDVLDIQLTQYGKHLLSSGKFRPMYYAFFDDDILYDSQYASEMVETQNNVETRIQEETPRLKTQYVHHGLETNIQKINEQLQNKNALNSGQKILPTQEKAYTLSAPIGTSSPSTKYLPAWDLRAIRGEFSGSITYEEDSFSMLRIPQIDIDLKYEISNRQVDQAGDNSDLAPVDGAAGVFGHDGFDLEFQDGQGIFIKRNNILIDISEENAPFDKNNFEIEVFLVEDQTDSNDSGGTKKILTPLSFKRQLQTGLLDNTNFLINEESDPSFVSYFMDITIDEEISDDDKIASVKRGNIYNTNKDNIPEDQCQ